MLDLEQRLDTASRELQDQLVLIHLAPPLRVIRRHGRRRVGRLVAAGLVAAGLVAAVVTVTGDVDGTDVASNPAEPEVSSDALLYPSEPIGGTPDEVMVGPQYGYGPRALLSSTDGTLFVVTLTDRLSSVLVSNAERRVFNDRTYTAELQGGELVYTSVDDCTTVSIRQSGGPDASPFDSNASALLRSLKVSDRHATVELADGWVSLGVGRVGTLIQIAFHSTIGGGNDQFNLMQLPDSSVAALVGLVGPPITQTAFNGQPAWTAQSGPSTSASMAWQDGPNAVLLYSDTGTLDELKQVAQTLQHDHGDQFVGHLGSAEHDALPGTMPTIDTIFTTNDPTNTDAVRCGTLQLSVQ